MPEDSARMRSYAGLEADPATFEVVKNSLYSAAEEMKVVLAKTAYSPILKVAGDYSCGIFDHEGDMVAQGPDLPIHLGSMPDAVRAVVAAWAGRIDEGDVFIHNDPYFGGSHLPDVNVVTPAFHEGRLLGFACVRAHWPDVGSATPGSYGTVTEIYGEGLRLPPVKLYEQGELSHAVDAIIFANVRTPEERRGDLRAQVAANRRAVMRLQTLATKYGRETLARIMQEVMDYSERMMRLMLAEMPDGAGSFEDICDGDGVIEDGDDADRPFRIRVHVEKRGDRITVDFAGSDPQNAGPMNAPLTVAASGVFCALKMVVDPNSLIPPNSGCWRAVTVTAPKGTVVNAEFPAPVVFANHEMSHRTADMMFGALAGFLPGNVMAASQGTSAILAFGGVDPRNGMRYVSYETIKGGLGARSGKDGINVVAAGISNTMNTPIEVLEMSFPLRVEEYVITADSGGAGTWRGGCGCRRTWRMLGEKTRATVCLERTLTPPFGVLGGKTGAAAAIALTTPDGRERSLVSKSNFDAPAGSLIVLHAPGAGGYGEPSARDPAAIGRDLIAGYVTPEAVRLDYGIEPNAAIEAAGED
jgi:N-methylhydantoinase B